MRRYEWRSALFGIFLTGVAYLSATWPQHTTHWWLLVSMVFSAVLGLAGVNGLCWLCRRYRITQRLEAHDD